MNKPLLLATIEDNFDRYLDFFQPNKCFKMCNTFIKAFYIQNSFK